MSIPYTFDPCCLRHLMDCTGHTATEVAAAIEVPTTTMVCYLEGRRTPSLADIVALQGFFRVPYEMIIGVFHQPDSESEMPSDFDTLPVDYNAHASHL